MVHRFLANFFIEFRTLRQAELVRGAALTCRVEHQNMSVLERAAVCGLWYKNNKLFRKLQTS